MAKKKIVSQKELPEIHIPIKWHVPDTKSSHFASNIVVQILENEFKLSFFEIKPEIRINETDSLPNEVRADCVASVIINAQKMPRLIEAMQKQYAIYQGREKSID